MKKILLLLLASTFLVFGCEKPEPGQTREKKYDVAFSFGGFTKTVGVMNAPATVSATGDTLKNYTDNLYYYVYNSSGALVNSIKQSSALASYGTIADKLASGTYTVYLMACKGSLGFSSESAASTILAWPSGAEYWNDTFYKKITLTVGTSSVSQSVRLDRVVGAIEVTITDAIPSNAAKISLVAQQETSAFQLSTGIAPAGGSSTKTRSFTLGAADIGLKNKKFLIHVANTSTLLTTKPLTLGIRGYTAQNGLLAEKIVTQVFCYNNKRTILTGELFNTANPSAGFTITVNPVWGTDLPARTFGVK